MNDEKREKKVFIKPEIKKVPLVAEEAVLAFCKLTTMSTGPGGQMGSCTSNLGMGQTADCSSIGS